MKYSYVASSQSRATPLPTLVVDIPTSTAIIAALALSSMLAEVKCDSSCLHLLRPNERSLISLYYERHIEDQWAQMDNGGKVRLISNKYVLSKYQESCNRLPDGFTTRSKLTTATKDFEFDLENIQKTYGVDHQISGRLFSTFTSHPVLVIGFESQYLDGMDLVQNLLVDRHMELSFFLRSRTGFDKLYRSPIIVTSSRDLQRNIDFLTKILPRIVIIFGSSLNFSLPIEWASIPKVVLLRGYTDSDSVLFERYANEPEFQNDISNVLREAFHFWCDHKFVALTLYTSQSDSEHEEEDDEW